MAPGSSAESLPLKQLARLTWLMQVSCFRPGEPGLPTCCVMKVVFVMQVVGVEHDLVTLPGEEHEQKSVRIGVTPHVDGQCDALQTYALNGTLDCALPTVYEVN